MRADVTLLDGRPAICTYEIDQDGFILYALHNASGDITTISEADFDHIEAQIILPEKRND